MPKKKLTYEEALNRLTDIVSSLEDENLSLEAALNLYKEGVSLAKFLKDTLNSWEGEITILRNSLNGDMEESFIKEEE